MARIDLPLTTTSSEARSERFSYACGGCGRCCRGNDIRVDPYELARLARNQGVTTSVFQAEYTCDGLGTTLNRTEDGACIFLGADGCNAYPDRPLACRLYPLSRHVSSLGEEWFGRATPDPETAGIYGTAGTIAEFLAAHDTALFMEASDQYYSWMCRAKDYLLEMDGADGDSDGEGPQNLLDMDSMVAAYCLENALDEPADIEERKRMHLEILERMIVTDKDGTV